MHSVTEGDDLSRTHKRAVDQHVQNNSLFLVLLCVHTGRGESVKSCPASNAIEQSFSKCGTWASSSGTQRNLRIKYKSGRVSTKV